MQKYIIAAKKLADNIITRRKDN